MIKCGRLEHWSLLLRIMEALFCVLLSVLKYIFILAVLPGVRSSCTSGFMNLNVIGKRAEQLIGSYASNEYLDDELRVVPDWNFNCSGNITSLLLGVEIIPDEAEYPQIQIWRRTLNRYNLISSRAITLPAGTFSSDGVIRYELSPPLSVAAGDVVGVKHPKKDKSAVQLFYQHNDFSAPYAYHLAQNEITFYASSGIVPREYILLSVITDIPQCVNGFLSFEALRQKVLNVNVNHVKKREKQLRIFPDINFTCNGNLTKWIFGATYDRKLGGELQIWRRTGAGQNNYVLVDSSVLPPGSQKAAGVFAYIPNPPLEFQEGDILGVYQRGGSDRIKVYYQETTGPVNYRRPGDVDVNPPLNENTLIGAIPVNQYDYPLVTVEIVTPAPISSTAALMSSTVSIDTTSFADQVSTTAQISTTLLTSTFPSDAVTMTSLEPSLTSTTLSTASDVQMTTLVSSNNFIVATNAAPVSTTLSSKAPAVETQSAVSITSLEIVVAQSLPIIDRSSTLSTGEVRVSSILGESVSFTLQSIAVESTSTEVRRPSSALSLPVHTTAITTAAGPSSSTPLQSSSIAALVAVMATVIIVIASTAVCVVVIIVIALRQKRRSKRSLFTEAKSTSNLTDIDNPMYAAPASDDTDNHLLELYSIPDSVTSSTLKSRVSAYAQPIQNSPTVNSSLYQWGIIVPTASQRCDFANSEGHYETDSIYSKLAPMKKHDGYQTLKSYFFEETIIYWEPGSDCASIYEQLSRKKFREIIREQIQVKEHLGSGQFGQVDKGVWASPDGPVDVAIKTLRAEASEMEKVKFLQEAAIMGQFHHPNIVKLLGVVTMGEPEMIVLELVKNGDLREYLHTLRPIPGELAPPSLPQQLLGYCRQIASGMEYLSKKSFVHRDLAARNILVDDKKTCKIADFGMSRDLSHSDYYMSQGGKIPVRWTAPEALHYKKYSTASDVWSFGVLMYEIWSLGHKPFKGLSNTEAITLIDSGYRITPPPGCPRAVYQFMMDCWHPKASKRPTFPKIVSRLSQPENQLLQWTDCDINAQLSTMLGAPLETGSNLHSDLQNLYL